MAGIVGSSATSEQEQQLRADRTPRGVSFAIHPSHIRTLLWLRWKVTLRGYTRNVGRIIGLIVMLLFFVPTLAGLALASILGYTQLPHDAAVGLLFLVVSGFFLIWAVLPLLLYSVNEGLDVTKLQIYPLTRGEQMVSLVLATLLDVSTLFLFFFYLAILLAWHATPLAAVITAVALIVAYILTVSFSQMLVALLMGLLRSRRYRDLSIIIFALFGSTCGFGSQFIGRFIVFTPGSDPIAQFGQAHVENYLHWTPPGMAAQAIVSANNGDYPLALLWLAGALLFVPVILALWAFFLDRGITLAESAGAGAGRKSRRRPVETPLAGGVATTASTAVAPVATRRGWRPLSNVALAITAKDARYVWRDPQLKAALVSLIFPVILVLFPGIFGGSSYNGDGAAFSLGGAAVLLAPLPALLVVYSFSINALGMERQGLQTLFLFPVRPLDIFWGKNLFTGLFAMFFVVALTIIKAVLTGGWAFVPLALCVGLAAVLLALGCGNVASVLFPFRWRQMRMGDSSSLSSENGCLRSIISMVVFFVVALLLIPIAVAVLVPLLLNHNEWLLISGPLTLCYGLAFHQIATRLIAPVLLRRAPEILAVTVREA